MLWKAYFDQGYGWTHYIFKIIAVLGLTTQAFEEVAWGIGVYTIFCFIFGWLFYKWKWINYEKEIHNHFDPFAKEVRAKMKIRTKVT